MNAMHSYRNRIRQYLRTVAPVPAASSFSLSSSGIDSRGCPDLIPNVLLFAEAPALDATELPDGATLTYTLLECGDSLLRSVSSSIALGTMTGAGGKGAKAAVFAGRPKFRSSAQWWGLRVDASAGVNAANKEIALEVALTGDPNW
jgi:hypothetical protein